MAGILEDAAKRHLRLRTDNRQASAKPETEMQETGPVVRRKAIVASSMSEKEAISQAEALGHSWFAFRNADLPGEPLSLLYSRVAGGWGIAEMR